MRKESSQPPAVFSCIAKNSISHFSQEPGNCESVKEEGIREPSEGEGVVVCLRRAGRHFSVSQKTKPDNNAVMSRVDLRSFIIYQGWPTRPSSGATF
jgi:hypothetical protein